MDIFEIVVNEIALEGLDGITVPTLWLRLTEREETLPFQLDLNLKNLIWEYIISHPSMEFFSCPTERAMPMIFNRFLGSDATTGKRIATAPDELEILNSAYSADLVQSSSQDVKGSCSQFYARENVTRIIKDEHLSVDSATEKYQKHKLVIVASQAVREKALTCSGINLQVVKNLSDMEYLILERIGRSRWQGELQNVLNNMIFKPIKLSHVHYVIKSLIKNGLVVKQTYTYLRPDKRNKICQQVLLHLPCYQRDCRSLFEIRVEMICQILAKSKNKSMNVADLKQLLDLKENVFKRLREKLVSKGYVEIINKNEKKNCRAIFKTMKLKSFPSEAAVEQVSKEENNLNAPLNTKSEPQGLVAELPLTYQGYRHIQLAGENGCSQGDILALLKGYGSLEARNICRRVNKAGKVRTIMVDEGKQRLQKYISKNFAKTSCHTNELLVEKNRMKQTLDASVASILETSGLESQENIPSVMSPNFYPLTNNESMDLNLTGNLECLNTPTRSTSKWDLHLTTKKMKRKNVILEYVNEQKLVEGIPSLVKILVDKETKEGCTMKICKKTLVRLILKMAEEGLLKYFCIPISSNGLIQEVEFLMSIDCDPSKLKEAIQQIEFRMYSQHTKNKIQEKTKDIFEVKTDFEMENDIVLIPNTNIHYGYAAKFQRFQAVHKYLWYLAYGHPNQYENLEVDIDDERVYDECKTWKRWVPPIPQNRKYGEGWIQLGAAAVVLPLSIITQFYKISYQIDGIEEFLQDSIKKHILVRHLPPSIKQMLLYKRKYMYAFALILEYLCFMGLTSLDQQKFQANTCLPKEEQMVFIHKHAVITDTRTSEKGYMEVTDKEYKQLDFYFDDYQSVEQYWFKLRDVSLMTQLGLKRQSNGDIDSHKYAQQLKKFVAEHITRKDVELNEDGIPPGDGKGAGGLDSSLFPHLYKNWFNSAKIKTTKSERLPKLVETQFEFANRDRKRNQKSSKQDLDSLFEVNIEQKKKPVQTTKRRRDSQGPRKRKRKKIEKTEKSDELGSSNVNGKNDDLENSFEVVAESNIGRKERVKGGKGRKRQSQTPKNSAAKKVKKPKPNSEHGAKNIGKIKLKYNDKVDLEALDNRMGKWRVKFSKSEDTMLIICKIASTVLHKLVKINHRKKQQHAVAWSVVRDLLHNHFPSLSKNKTSYACGRRVLNLFKNPNTRLYHDLTVADVLEDKTFLEEFVPKKEYNEEELGKVYGTFVDAITEKFEQNPGVVTQEIPNNKVELKNKYTIKAFYKKVEVDLIHIVPHVSQASDIEKCVLENLFYVMLSMTDQSNKFQAYKVFENYQETLIKQVWDHFSLTGNVSRSHNPWQSRKRVLPYGVSTYHFSQSHFYSFRIVEEVFMKVADVFRSLSSDKLFVCDTNNTSSSSVLTLAMLLLGSPEKISTDVVLSNLILHRTDFRNANLELNLKKPTDAHATETLFSKVTLHHDKSQIELLSLSNKSENYLYDMRDINRRLDLQVHDLKAKLLPEEIAVLKTSVIVNELSDNFLDFDKLIMEQIINVIDEAGSIGIAISEIKDCLVKKFNTITSQDCQKYLDILTEYSEAYYVGMYQRRIVLKKHSKSWFVTGASAIKPLKDVTNTDNLNNDEEVQPNTVATISENIENSPDPQAGHYKTIRFLCRPWHDVGGEINYRSAKLLLFGVFLHIFWNPGVTLNSLTKRFLPSIQRVALLEILEKLIIMKLVTKRCLPKVTSWQLFSDIIPKNKSTESSCTQAGEFFEPTADAMLHASRLNEIFEKLIK